MKQHHKVTITAGAWCEAWRVLAGGCRVPCCCVLAEHRTTTTERVLMLLLFLLRNVPIRYESKGSKGNIRTECDCGTDTTLPLETGRLTQAGGVNSKRRPLETPCADPPRDAVGKGPGHPFSRHCIGTGEKWPLLICTVLDQAISAGPDHLHVVDSIAAVPCCKWKRSRAASM